MEGIPGELIFVLIFIAFSVLEGLGRKKKAERQGEVGPTPTPRRRPGPVGSTASPGSDVTPTGAADASTSGPASSEEMIPSEVWEEILGLARGKPPVSKPKRVEEPVAESSWDRGSREEVLPEFEARSLEPLEARPDVVRADFDEYRVSRTLVTRPSKLRPEPEVSRRPRKVGVRRGLFGGGTAKELQKAVILQEVLGPPVGMKE